MRRWQRRARCGAGLLPGLAASCRLDVCSARDTFWAFCRAAGTLIERAGGSTQPRHLLPTPKHEAGPPRTSSVRDMEAGSAVRQLAGLRLPAVAEAGAPPMVDVAALDGGHLPEFYLPYASIEQLADCFAVVEGARLPLHSQVLGAQSAVLRELFLGQREGGLQASRAFCLCLHQQRLLVQLRPLCHCIKSRSCTAPQEPADLSAAFLGASLSATACFLCLVYRPHDAISRPNLAALAGKRLLGEAAVLAHKLDAGGLLSAIARYLEGRPAAHCYPPCTPTSSCRGGAACRSCKGRQCAQAGGCHPAGPALPAGAAGAAMP